MLGKHSHSSVSSRFGAIFKRRNKASDSFETESNVGEPLALKPARVESNADLEVHRIDIEQGKSVNIYVSSPAEASYFEEEAEYAPTIVSVERRTVAEDISVNSVKKERVVVAEPADLFINALRRPARQKFDASTPRIKTKAPVEEAVAEPEVIVAPVEEVAAIDEIAAVTEVLENVEVHEVIDTPVVEAVAAPVEEVVAEPEVVVESIEIPVETVDMSAEEVLAVSVEEEDVDSEEFFANRDVPEVMKALTVEAVAAPVEEVIAEPEVIVAPVEEAVAEPEVIVAPVEEEDVDSEEFFANMDVPEVMKALAVEAVAAPVEEVVAEPEVVVKSIEIPVETVEATVAEASEVIDVDFDLIENSEILESKVEQEVINATESVKLESLDISVEDAPTPVLALPASTVVPALPQKIEVPELESVEEFPVDYTAPVIGSNEVLTSESESLNINTETHVTTVERELPLVVSNVNRDLLFAFRTELEHDEVDFFATTMDDNRAFREDDLDKAEVTFKIRRPTPKFNGDFRASSYNGNSVSLPFNGNFRTQNFTGNLRSLYN